MSFDQSALDMLSRHPWPGNVREMRNVIEQAVLLASGPVIDAEQLNLCSPRAFLAQVERVIVPGEDANTFPLEGLELAAVERDLLQRALEHTRWNVTHAARLLGLSRDTMRYRIDKFSLAAPASPEAPRIGH